MPPTYDAVIIGSGPNGLAAAIELARNNRRVLIVEGAAKVGGGTQTEALTLPGFNHDFCSAAHPMGVLSPFFQSLPLDQFGLEWVYPKASVAHPLDEEPAVLLSKSIAETAANLGVDEARWTRLFTYFQEHGAALLRVLASMPSGPLRLMRSINLKENAPKHFSQVVPLIVFCLSIFILRRLWD